MKSRSRSSLPLFSLIAITMAQSVVAETGTWIGVFDGTWDTTPTNWDGLTDFTPWDATLGQGNTAIFNTTSLAAVVAEPVNTNGITFSLTGALSGSTITLAGTTPTIAVATGQTGTISSEVAGSAGLTKSDPGLLTLSSATYSGGTTVNGGRLALVDTKTGSPNFTTDAELEFNLSTGDQQLIGGTLSGTGKLIKKGGSNLILSDWSGNQTVALTGTDSVIDVQAGTLSNFFAAGAFGPVVDWSGNEAGLTVASGATFDMINNSVTVDEMNGAGTINKDSWDIALTLTIGVKNGSGTFTGSILNPKNSLAIIKQGAGTQRLSGSITHKGGTTVNGGRLVLENTKTGSQSYTTNAELEFNLTTGNQQFESGTFSGTGKLIKTGGNELILSNWSGNQTVALTGVDSVIDVQEGILGNFTPAGAYGPIVNWTGNLAGLTVATGATFEIRNNSVIVDELSGAGTINKGTWDTAVTLTIGVNGGSGNFTGSMTQTAGTPMSLVKQGSGTQTLSSPCGYNGSTTIDGGTLALGASNILPGTALIIGNATLDAATFTDTVGILDVTAATTINLGAGGALVFADSNGVDWSGGTLNITGSFVSGSSIKFATNAGLDSNQLAVISVNGSGAGTATLDGDGYLVMSVSDPFTAWSGGASFEEDANNDGVDNGLAWLLGAADKDVNGTGLLPNATQNGGNLKLTFTCLKIANRGSAVLNLQYSKDLGITDPWATHEVVVPDTAGTVGSVTFTVPSVNPDPELVNLEATIPASAAAPGTKLFARLNGKN